MDRGAWRATVQGVAQSQTWLNNSHTFKVPTEGVGMRRLADHHFPGKPHQPVHLPANSDPSVSWEKPANSPCAP